ncbi:MAG TPA: hypothetical protein DEA08_24935 [Planctomycetes bacterium]|nr:hypothetical protein [Planctomycetota bacterium]
MPQDISVGETTYQASDVVKHMVCKNAWNDQVASFLRQEVIHRMAAESKLSLSDEELQRAVDAFRKENALYMAKDAQAWLDENGLGLEDLEHFVETSALEGKLLGSIPEEALNDYWSEIKHGYDQLRLSVIEVESEPLLNELAQQIEDEEEEFAELALQHSKDDSAGRGGALGWVPRGSLSEEVGTKLWAAEVGQTVKEAAALRLYLLEEKKPAERNEEVDYELRQALLTAAVSEALGAVDDTSEDDDE